MSVDGKLLVENFLVLKKAEIEIKKINLVIGPQANGKSLIAKLISYFNSLSEDFYNFIKSDDDKRELNRTILEKFQNRFPRYTWEGGEFFISYETNELKFEISGVKGAKGKTLLSVKYTSNFFYFVKSLRNKFTDKIDELRSGKLKKAPYSSSIESKAMMDVVEPKIRERYPQFFSESIFVPASRSFFANLQKNIFTFLASNIEIDPYLKDFGRRYETSKFLYGVGIRNSEHGNADAANEINAIVEAIVKGQYEYAEDQDWLVTQARRVNLINASSGQQESLPMLLVLSVWPFLLQEEQSMLFIEEPEAHLFPNSQSHILSLISVIHKCLSKNFFITTHSPYIVAALNNLILADECINEGKITSEKFKQLNGGFGEPINFEDVAAYTIENGFSKSIVDKEYKLIGADILDSVSEHFESVMNNLLDC